MRRAMIGFNPSVASCGGFNNMTGSQAAEFIASNSPEEPVLLMSSAVLRAEAMKFLFGFPGKVLYAVKSNPDPAVISCLAEAGISSFDVASLPEIELVRSIAPQATCHFNHPVKASASIRAAYHRHRIRDFVVDSGPELEKVLAHANPLDIVIQLRLKVASGSNTYDFGNKFGLAKYEAISMGKQLASDKIAWGVSFHIGSQCETPAAFREALELCQSVMAAVGGAPKYVNVGGGFPSRAGTGTIPPLEEFFDVIGSTGIRLLLPELLCEPGRGLVWRAGQLITRIVLRNRDRLYLNDGVYGSLGEVDYLGMPLQISAVKQRPSPAARSSQAFSLFGPTCDPFDAIEQKVMLPEDVESGDWLVIDGMGAYSTALGGHFNGFRGAQVVALNS